MNDIPEKLRVLVVCVLSESPETDIIKKVENVIKRRYKSESISVSSIEKLSSKFYYLMPHYVVLDSRNQEAVERLSENYKFLEQIKERPFILIDYPDSDIDLIKKMGIKNLIHIPYNATTDDIKRILDKASKVVGFEASTGKVDKRIVQKNIKLSIKIEQYDTVYEGITTGLNKNGLGARLKTGGKPYRELLDHVGCSCMVAFSDPDISFMPVEGEILRVEESWDNNYDAFMAVSFKQKHFYFDAHELKILDRLITKQEDKSIIKKFEDDGSQENKEEPE